MKRVWIGVLTAALVIALGATTALAAGHGAMSRRGAASGDCVRTALCRTDGTCSGTGTGCGRNYVDADGDGVCDRCGSDTCLCGGTGTGCGRNYVDADGDGVCDHYDSACAGGCRRACAR